MPASYHKHRHTEIAKGRTKGKRVLINCKYAVGNKDLYAELSSFTIYGYVNGMHTVSSIIVMYHDHFPFLFITIMIILNNIDNGIPVNMLINISIISFLGIYLSRIFSHGILRVLKIFWQMFLQNID